MEAEAQGQASNYAGLVNGSVSEKQSGTLSAEIATALKELNILHDTIDQLSSRLTPIVHQLPGDIESAKSALMDATEPARTDLAHEAHNIVSTTQVASRRIRSLLNNLGI
jgi:hypothetical protein